MEVEPDVLVLFEYGFPAEGDDDAVKAALLHLGVGHEVLLGANDSNSSIWNNCKDIWINILLFR